MANLITLAVLLLCYLSVHVMCAFNVTVSTSLQTWNDVIADSTCDVLGTGLPEGVSVSDIHVNIPDTNQEVWIGSTVDTSPLIELEVYYGDLNRTLGPDQKLHWYNPHHTPAPYCVSATVTNGSLTPRVRLCDTKLASLCVQDNFVVHDITHWSYCQVMTYVALGVLLIIVASWIMKLIFGAIVYALWSSRRRERRLMEAQTTLRDDLSGTKLKDETDHSPPPVYTVLMDSTTTKPLTSNPPAYHDLMSTK